MLTTPMDVLTKFPVRKTGKQKQSFRDAVQAYAVNLGYPVIIQKGNMGVQNIVIGDPKTARYLVTAHYDTPARMLLPNFISPCNLPLYLLYQIVLVLLLLAVASAASYAVDILLSAPKLSFFVWYMVYFGQLLLMLFGPANKSNANDNTSGIITVLEIAKSMPENQRHKVCFVLFDLEETGLIGSASYRQSHKSATEHQVILNLDCVGDGDDLMMFPTKKLRSNTAHMAALGRICGQFGPKRLQLHNKGFAMCPSDQKNFPMGVGIMALRRKRWIGLYCDRIHTNRDTILNETNVNILRAALTSLITGGV